MLSRFIVKMYEEMHISYSLVYNPKNTTSSDCIQSRREYGRIHKKKSKNDFPLNQWKYF